ncbi:MAG: hypothetical protein ACOC0X_01780 [Halobacteriota archaeon]
MKAAIAVVVAAVILGGMAVVLPVMAAAGPPQADGVAVDAAPGERLMAGVGATDAEFDADVRERSYGMAVSDATGDLDAIADLVQDQLANASERLTEIEDRIDDLEAAHDDGSITAGRFQAEVARLEAERRSIERLTNISATATAGHPDAHLAERGINVSAIAQLRERAHALDGRNVSRIARSIAGPGAGEPPGHRPNLSERIRAGTDRAVERIGNAEDAQEAIDGASRLHGRAEQQVDRATRVIEARGGDAETLDAARDRLEVAGTALEDARDALAEEDPDAARALASDAGTAAAEAIALAQEAIDSPGGPPGSPPGDPPGGPPDDA